MRIWGCGGGTYAVALRESMVVFLQGGFVPFLGGSIWCIRDEIQMQILKNALLPPPKEGNKPAISLTMAKPHV